MEDCPSIPGALVQEPVQIKQALRESQRIVRVGVDDRVAVLRRVAPLRLVRKRRQKAPGVQRKRIAAALEREIGLDRGRIEDGGLHVRIRIHRAAPDAHFIVQVRG